MGGTLDRHDEFVLGAQFARPLCQPTRIAQVEEQFHAIGAADAQRLHTRTSQSGPLVIVTGTRCGQ